jgi:nucleotide-binding universal stress UspA family protein
MRILIVANGSLPGKDVLMFSKQFVQSASEPPTLLTVLNPWMDHPPCQNNGITNFAHEDKKYPYLHSKTVIGQPVEGVIREIKECGYDLVFVGVQGNPLLRRIFHSSSAMRIAELAPCPVVVVKGKVGPVQRILMCDSGYGKSQILGRFTSQLMNLLPGDEEVTILHIMSQISAGPGIRGEQLRAMAEKLIQDHTPEGELLEQDTQFLERFGIHPIPKIRHGLVVDEILAEAREGDYDLVIIGAKRQNWQRYLLDDITTKIIKQVNLPVLVVK